MVEERIQVVEVSERPSSLRGSVRVYSSGGLLHLLCLGVESTSVNVSLVLYKAIL